MRLQELPVRRRMPCGKAMSLQMTAAQIQYMICMRRMHLVGEIRSSRLAETLGVTKSSVHNMVRQLTEMGLVTCRRYGAIEFTENGIRIVRSYYEQFERICHHLEQSLLLENAHASKIALLLASGLDPEAMGAFLEKLPA